MAAQTTLAGLLIRIGADVSPAVSGLQGVDRALATSTQRAKGASTAVSKLTADSNALSIASLRTATGFGRVNDASLTIVRQLTGLSPIAARLTDVFSTMWVGAAPSAGFFLAIAGAGAAYRALTADVRAAKEAQQSWLETMTEAARKRALGPDGALRQGANAAILRRTEIDRQLPMLRGMAGAGDEWAMAKVAELTAESDRLMVALREANAQLKELSAGNKETGTSVSGLTLDLSKLNEQVAEYNRLAMMAATIPPPGAAGLLTAQRPGALPVPTFDFLARGAGDLPTGFAGPAVPPPPKQGSFLQKHGYAIAAGAGMLIGAGVAGNGGFAAGVGGALSMGMQGASIGGPVGAVVGAVGGLVSGLLGHSKKVKEEAKRLREAQKVFDMGLELRRAQLKGDEDAVAMIRLQTEHEKELLEARRAGMKGSQLYALQQIQSEEVLALSRDLTKAAAEEAAQAEEELAAARERSLQMMEDLTVRAARAAGFGGAADRLALRFGQRREYVDAVAGGASEGELALLKAVQAFETQRLQLDTWREQQITAIQDAANAQLDALATQEDLARRALQTNEEQLRAQERTVDSLRSVVESLSRFSDSLKLSGLSPLTPGQRIAEARGQVDMLRALALGGDATAAASLPDAIRALLEEAKSFYGGTATPGFVAEFESSQSLIQQVRDQFGAQLSVEERMLAVLEESNNKLSHQINELQAQQQAIRDAAAEQIRAVEMGYAAQVAELAKAVTQLLGINEDTDSLDGIESNTGQQLLEALAQVNSLTTSLNAARENAAQREADMQETITALYARIADLENRLNGGWGGGGGGGGYNPEDDPEWAGRLVDEVASMRREVVLAIESMEG